MSDVGMPLLITLTVTLGGLAIAYLFLRRQLRQDVELRAADRRAAAVNRFGIEIHGMMQEFLSDSSLGPLFGQSETLPYWRDIDEARRRLSIAVGELDPLPNFIAMTSRLGVAWNAAPSAGSTSGRSGEVRQRPETGSPG